MREYELTVVYDLAVMEVGGADASVQNLTTHVQNRGGTVVKVDHWGRRRLAYPIGRTIDADYIVSRVELEPGAVVALEEALRIDEKIFRHLVVRADELPVPPPPREPRRTEQPAAIAPAPVAVAEPVVAAEPAVAEPVVAAETATEAVASEPETVAEVPAVAEVAVTVDEATAAVAEVAPAVEAEATPAEPETAPAAEKPAE